MSTDSSDDLIRWLCTSFSSIAPNISESDLPQLSPQIFPSTSYTDNEKIEISQWLITSAKLIKLDEDEAKYVERLGSLNIHLSARTTLLGSKPSIADLALYFRLAPTVRNWSVEERTGTKGYHNIVRHIDFVQSSPLLGLSLKPEKKIAIDPSDVKFVHKPVDAKEQKEQKKREKAAATAAEGNAAVEQLSLPIDQGKESLRTPSQATLTDKPPGASGKKDKKEKALKQQKAAPATSRLSPRLIDLRVGHILKAVPHPDADSLYVSTINCGDAAGTENTSEYEGLVVRTVCSGLNGLVPIEEMQGRKIIAVCNLKPVTMRGVKSAAMVLAASPRSKQGEADGHQGSVELVDPPADAEAGERVNFEGWEGEPEGQLNPKKKVFESLQPGFTTTQEGAVGFDAKAIEALKGEAKALGLLKTNHGGICKVKSLKGAAVR